MSLADYVRSGIALEMDNSQTRAIAGDVGTPYGQCTEEMLETARRNLAEHFSWVGVTERFDESIVLLRRTFGWSDVRYMNANVARSATPPSESDLALIEEMNSLDMALYRDACLAFDKRIEAEEGFAEELEQLRRANERYKRWGKLTYTLPARIKRRLAPEVRRSG